MKHLNTISRIILGIVFIFSGFVKAVDPLGSVYKFNDYFIAFGTSWMEPLSFFFSVTLSSLEFIIGFAILFGLKIRLTSWGGLLFMAFFTPLTFYIYLTNPVSDCGCFGDALILSNKATFIKNIFFFIFSIIIFAYRKKFKSILSEKVQWGIIFIGLVFIASIITYSYRHLPIIDFRPWKIGNNVIEEMKPKQEEIAETFLVYKNKNTGEIKDYPMNDYPWNDSVWKATWEFVEQKRNIIQEYINAPIGNFIIVDEYGEELTETFITDSGYQFLLFAYDLDKAARKPFQKINTLAGEAEANGISFICLTSTPYSDIDDFRHEVQATYPFYNVDPIALKTAIRANPGLILLKNGIVMDKWHYNDIPDFESIKEAYIN
ncbi:MAG: DoxX family protein [Bacteroidales bacterium]|nr:DoxX family protein [Bacteroidales bacterium]